MRHSRTLAMLAIATLMGSPVAAQTPARDPSARLKQVLPPDVADRVLATIAEARARQLPAEALEHRALKFAAKGVAPSDIEKSVSAQAERMGDVRTALQAARGTKPADDEVEAGAEAMRKGVDGVAMSALAKSAPSGRSLAVPLYVVGSLIDRGLPSDQALQKVQARLQARATDADLQSLPAQAVAGRANKPAETGRDLAATRRPAGAGAGRATSGAPAGVPANVGGARPTTPGSGHRP